MLQSKELDAAWQRRQEKGLFADTQALRVFHGPGEGSGILRSFAIDRFGEHYWVTRWEDAAAKEESAEAKVLAVIAEFLGSRGAASVVWLGRPEKGVPALPKVLLGKAPDDRFEVQENGARYWIRLLDTRHPGLFLDHAPLRRWLAGRARGWRVLNTFAYTGSLSVACGLGGAAQVTTLDLSKPTIQWAQDNWQLNGLDPSSARFIAGDVFEWLPRLRREGQVFDCVILDPPSFSRGKKATFSTAKDLKRLHELALDLLPESGWLVTSINSANVSWSKYEADVLHAAREKRIELRVARKIEQPESFPARPGSPETGYLKGWVFKASRRS
jgi:23S rRNA (cytosine1962-C5)-methyltransferase